MEALEAWRPWRRGGLEALEVLGEVESHCLCFTCQANLCFPTSPLPFLEEERDLFHLDWHEKHVNMIQSKFLRNVLCFEFELTRFQKKIILFVETVKRLPSRMVHIGKTDTRKVTKKTFDVANF